MKNYLVIMVATTLFGFPVFSIAVQNFSGSWVRDNVKSDPTPDIYWLTRQPNAGGAAIGGRGGGGGRSAPVPIVITVQHDASSLTVTNPSGIVQKYPLDGKPFSKIMDTGMAKAVISASTQGDTIVITTSALGRHAGKRVTGNKGSLVAVRGRKGSDSHYPSQHSGAGEFIHNNLQ